MADEVVGLCPFNCFRILQQHSNNRRRHLRRHLRRAQPLVKVPFPLVSNTEAQSGGEVGQHPGITRIPPPLGTVAPVKPGVFPTWGTCIAGDQL